MKLFGKNFDENDLFIAFLCASTVAAGGKKEGNLEASDAITEMIKIAALSTLISEKERRKSLELAKVLANMPPLPKDIIRYRDRVEQCESKDKHQS